MHAGSRGIVSNLVSILFFMTFCASFFSERVIFCHNIRTYSSFHISTCERWRKGKSKYGSCPASNIQLIIFSSSSFKCNGEVSSTLDKAKTPFHLKFSARNAAHFSYTSSAFKSSNKKNGATKQKKGVLY